MNPLKQGLKQIKYHILFTYQPVWVKEVNPLKQGLKPTSGDDIIVTYLFVKEVNPLKQGLKLCHLLSV